MWSEYIWADKMLLTEDGEKLCWWWSPPAVLRLRIPRIPGPEEGCVVIRGERNSESDSHCGVSVTLIILQGVSEDVKILH